MSDFDSVKVLLKKYNVVSDKYISQEFQKYAFDLAQELRDTKHKSLYMKLAKSTPRVLLEQAKYFVKDASNVQNRGKLFMWKLTQLKKELKGSEGNRGSKGTV